MSMDTRELRRLMAVAPAGEGAEEGAGAEGWPGVTRWSGFGFVTGVSFVPEALNGLILAATGNLQQGRPDFFFQMADDGLITFLQLNFLRPHNVLRLAHALGKSFQHLIGIGHMR